MYKDNCRKIIDEVFFCRMNIMGTDTFSNNDPWGVRDEPDDFQGRSNTDIRQQQQSIIQRKTY